MTTSIPFWDIVIRISIAAILGGLIGLERAESGTPAGLRTNMIIAMSTCLFTLIALHVLSITGSGDPVMMAHIISGVGFLGAGIVFHPSNSRTSGLTTAASIWLVAGLGMAVGAGYLALAFFATIMGLLVLHALEPVSEWLDVKAQERRECKHCGTSLRGSARRRR